jgi:hypothetical protein
MKSATTRLCVRPAATLHAISRPGASGRARGCLDWDGCGPCPIDDPLGAGIGRLEATIDRARQDHDHAAVTRLYEFALCHIVTEHRVASGTLWIPYRYGDRIGEAHRLRRPELALAHRWSATQRSLQRGDGSCARMLFSIDRCRGTARVAFVPDAADGDRADIVWRFGFVSRAA